jgi:heme-degrading monooxygenase HmoA
MIAVANRIFVNSTHAELFETNFRNRAGLVDRMPGFISNQLLRPVKEGDPYIVLTFWESRVHFDQWVHSEAFVKGHARSGTLPKDAFTRPSYVELHEVILDSSKPDLTPEPHGEPLQLHGQ